MITRNIKSAVITGPTGAIGSALCTCLAKKGIRVYAICHPGSKRRGAIPEMPEIKVIECDLNNLAVLEKYIPKKIDAFFHLGWMGTTGDSRNDMLLQINNIKYTIDAVRVAKALNCQIFIGAGSQAEYGYKNIKLTSETPCNPENGYGIAKYSAGLMSRIECNKISMEHIWVRILSVYGPHDSESSFISMLVHNLLKNEIIAMTKGEQVWDYLYSDDAARALYLCAIHGVNGSVYPLGSGEGHTIREYSEIIKEIIAPNALLGIGGMAYAKKQIMYLVADSTKIKEDVGFKPEHSFKEGITKYVDFLKNEYK